MASEKLNDISDTSAVINEESDIADHNPKRSGVSAELKATFGRIRVTGTGTSAYIQLRACFHRT